MSQITNGKDPPVSKLEWGGTEIFVDNILILNTWYLKDLLVLEWPLKWLIIQSKTVGSRSKIVAKFFKYSLDIEFQHLSLKYSYLRTILSETMQGELSWHSSQPSAHGKHWKAMSLSYRVRFTPWKIQLNESFSITVLIKLNFLRIHVSMKHRFK